MVSATEYIILGVFVGYLLAVLAVSVFAYINNQRAIRAAAGGTEGEQVPTSVSLEQHFLGGRSLGKLVTVLTLAGTVYSGYSLIAVPADFARNGMVGVRWFGNTISVQLGALLIAPRLRRLGISRKYVSPLAFVQDRWRSPTLTCFTVVATVVPALLFLAAQVISLRDTVASTFAGLLEPNLTTLLCCALIVAYEWFGGMTSVAWTDVLQGMVMTAGTVGGAFLIANAWGGFADACAELKPLHPEFYNVPSRHHQLAMFAYAAGASAFFFNAFCITRLYAARHYSSVKLAMVMITVMEFVIKLPGMLLGLQGAARLPNAAPSEIFSSVALELTSHGWLSTVLMSALLVAAMAAIMSTADSSLMALTNVAANDVILKFRPAVPEFVFRLLSVIAMAAAVGFSYVFFDLTALFVLQNSMLMVGVAPSFYLGLYVPRMHSGTIIVATLCGLLVALGLSFGLLGASTPQLVELQIAGNTIGLALLLCVAALVHALERRYPEGRLRDQLDRLAYLGLRQCAHHPEYDQRPLHVPSLIVGLDEPLAGWRMLPACVVLSLLEAFLVPWYLQPGTPSEAYVDGVPVWACVTILLSGVGAVATISLWTFWRDHVEDGQGMDGAEIAMSGPTLNAPTGKQRLDTVGNLRIA